MAMRIEAAGALRERLSWLRFAWHRSYARANRAQLERVARDYFERPADRHPRRLVSIGLTHRCQLRCEYCATDGYRKDGPGELGTAEVVRLLDAVARSRHVFHQVSFLGGECLLRRDLDELVRAATERGLLLHLSTNGLALDEARIARLLAAGLNSVFVAWELGAPKNTQAARRHAAVERAVRACARRGLPCFLSVCVCRDDVWNGHVEAALAAGRALGAAGVRLFAVRPSGAWLHKGDDALLDAAERTHLRSLCRSGYAWLTDDAEKAAGRTCAAFARRIVYVSPYGELQPCHFFPFGFGNVRAGGFDAALDRMWSHPMLLDRYPDCALEHRAFRTEHVAPLAGGARLPLMV